MKIETKNRWTTALRSNEYEQGVGKFEADGKFCALGVLCDVMGQPTVDEYGSGNWSFVNKLTGGSWEAGDRITSRLARMNDKWGKSFAEIADWIDENIAVTP